MSSIFSKSLSPSGITCSPEVSWKGNRASKVLSTVLHWTNGVCNASHTVVSDVGSKSTDVIFKDTIKELTLKVKWDVATRPTSGVTALVTQEFITQTRCQ